MKHILKYRLYIMLRNRTSVFWSLLFPIILMTMFGMVLRSSMPYTEFDTVPIAIVDNASYQNNTDLQNVITSAKTGDHALFKVSLVSQEEAETLLNSDKIKVYVKCGENFDIHVKNSGLEQTITQTFFDEYLQKNAMIHDLMARGANMEQIQALFTSTTDYVNENSTDVNATNLYFYTALAMSAMFGGMWAIHAVIDTQADQSQKGARVSLSPTNKGLYLLSSLILNLGLVFIFLCIQFLYVYIAFDIHFGNHLPYMFLLLLIGDIAGSSFGFFIGATFKTKDPLAKIGILSSITMMGNFLAGMMFIQLKWIISHFAPFINYINPVNMITDGLYSLYYYGVGERFYSNLISLIIFSLICYMISFIILSKKQYNSLGVQ